MFVTSVLLNNIFLFINFFLGIILLVTGLRHNDGEGTTPSYALKRTKVLSDLLNTNIKTKIIKQTGQIVEINFETDYASKQEFIFNNKLIFTKEANSDLIRFHIPIWYDGEEVKTLSTLALNFNILFSVHHVTGLTIN